jgi:hypothetical protein
MNRTDEGLMRTPNRNSSSLEVFRSWLETMLCVGLCVGSGGKYGLLTGLSSPGVGMLRSFEPYHPPKRPEASLRKASAKSGVVTKYVGQLTVLSLSCAQADVQE